MKLEDAYTHVKAEVLAILKRDGILPSRPYIVTEVIGRARTWKLEGVPHGSSQGMEIRKLVEKVCAEMSTPRPKVPAEIIVPYHDEEDTEAVIARVGPVRKKLR